MDRIYPAGPQAVPADLTQATSAYKRNAWLAMAGLTAFVVLYLALSSWFTWTGYRLLKVAALNGEWLSTGVVGLGAVFLAVFMWKALFFVQHRYEIEDIEITADDQPQLFEFLHRLADEAKAPRVHRVFLSPRVNAAVFYDLSIINLILPSKKNLEIGLALINVLTLGELKAVLAHEFGHFAQRSMAVGRWVYIAQQIAGHIIAKRDALDKFLATLSRIDLRVAWIGWLLSLIVWSIRSLMETVFRVVLLAQRALSREMEFQADLVAVSLTGSDALVHALHRLQAADDAWSRTLNFAAAEARAGRAVPDLFEIQQRIIEKLRLIWNQPDYGLVQPLPTDRPHEHRVFKAQLAQPPRMWSTHPTNVERENNAKRTYIPAPHDERSAWALFDDVPQVKQQMSTHVLRHSEAEPVTMQQALAKLDADYKRAYLDPKYRGAYLGRSVVRQVETIHELYDTPLTPDAVRAAVDAVYPPTLTAQLEQLRALEDERLALQALLDGHATATGGAIVHRGKQLKARELPRALAGIEQELAALGAELAAHDRAVRTAHRSAALTLGQGWDTYLGGLLEILHYAEHAEANVRDAQGLLANVYAVVTADGRVSGKERARLLDACTQLFNALQPVYETECPQIALDRTLLRRLSIESWAKALEEFKLPAPATDNLADWLNVIDGWVNSCAGALGSLRLAALEQLLLAEAQVARFVREGMKPTASPEPSRAPQSYAVLLPGRERERQKRLDWWDRFHTADGIVPTLARLAVACGIVGAVVGMSNGAGTTSLQIYNGLGRAVNVTIGAEHARVQPFASAVMKLSDDDVAVRTTTLDGELIEAFDAAADAGSHYVYNVAAASPLVEWTVVYGAGSAPPERKLGATRWSETHADYAFQEPPKTLSSSSSAPTRTVLDGMSDRPPEAMLELVGTQAERAAMIAAHVRWDQTGHYAAHWIHAARDSDDLPKLLQQRITRNPQDILALRSQQDYTDGAAREAICAQHRAMAMAHPKQPDLQYVAVRCLPDDAQRDEQFLALYAASPQSPWLSMAAGYVFSEEGDWARAVAALEHAAQRLPAFADTLALDAARIRRLTGGAHALDPLAKHSRTLRYFMTIESTEVGTDALDDAYRQMQRGALERAWAEVERTQNGDRLLRLLAASDGANSQWVAQALQLSLQRGVDSASAWSAFALAWREHRNLAHYANALREQGVREADLQQVIEFLRAAQTDPLATDADALLRGVELATRGHAYSAACVVLGNRAPAAWRTRANLLLFVPERPYIAPAVETAVNVAGL